MKPRIVVLLVLLAGAIGLPAGAQLSAPAGRCQLDATWERSNSLQLPSGQYNTFAGGGVVARCPNQRLTLQADSLESYGDEGRLYFVGKVRYSEPRLRLTSDYLTYFQREERILALGSVDASLPTGSRLVGPQLDYLRGIAPVRVKQQATAPFNPTITVVQKDSAGRTRPPLTITGNTVYLDGDSVVAASGAVVLIRPPTLRATGDSILLDGTLGLVRLLRGPKVMGTQGRPFTLVGEVIDLLSRRRKLERVLAKGAAQVTSEELNLKSDTVDLRVTNDTLQRIITWGTSRATATSPTQTIVADSIDVLMPAQRVREMHAVRRASAEGLPDSLKVPTKERDRLTGDTIVARFDTVASADTSTKPQIRELRAVGHATSLQHSAPRDSTLRRPAIVYVRGRRITVTFDSARVSRVKVADPDRSGGLYLEPNVPRARTAAPGAPAAAGAVGTPRPASPAPVDTARPLPRAPSVPPPSSPRRRP